MTDNVILEELMPRLRAKESIFFTFAQDLVDPSFDDSIPTACVIFNSGTQERCINFKVNKTFWGSLNPEEKYFLFVHEVLHVLLNHGYRGKQFLETLSEKDIDYDILNKAMDIAINELIISQYSKYPLILMPSISKGCFIDTCFPNRTDILNHQTFEYYYNLLLNQKEIGGESFDIHIFTDDIFSDTNGELVTELTISEEQKSEGIETSSDKEIKIEYEEKYVPNISNRLQIALSSALNGVLENNLKTNWYKINRRMNHMPRNFFIPAYEPKKDSKYKLVIYCDVSSSVENLSKMFFTIIKTLDSTKFDLDLYVFASRVAKVSDDMTYAYAGGGTEIDRVLEHAKIVVTEKIDQVLVLTDAQFANIYSRKGYEKWTFLLSDGNYKHFVPFESKILVI